MIPRPVLSRWSAFADAAVRPFGTGLINKTFLVENAERRAVFQRLHPVFQGSVNDDIDAVTRFVEARGMNTPRIVPADDGALCVPDDEGRPWRALTVVDGKSVDRVTSPALAFEGARLVALFHDVVSTLAYDYRHVRPGVHDLKKHEGVLVRALDEHRGHRLYSDVEPVARALLSAVARVRDVTALPLRHCHGDLKISNLLFDTDGRGVCLVDLDTLQKMPWAFEMGDALRSWCNPAGEDVERTEIDVDIFRAALSGYASGGARFVTSAEKAALVEGLFHICVELSCRFLADALNESYFGFDATRFGSRGEHNLLRARGQWTLAQAVERERRELEDVVRRSLGE